jgi:anti-sigma regulatory factor (Ser/Thr protein kinase)
MDASLSGLTGRQRRRPVRSARLPRPGGWRPGSRAGVLHGLEAQLPAAPVSAGTARHLARQLLTDCGLAALTDDVLLVTSELAANAITASRDSRISGGSRGSSAAASTSGGRRGSSAAASTSGSRRGSSTAASTPAIALWLARTPDGLLVAVADPAAADRLPWLLRLAPLGPLPLAGDAADRDELAEHGRGLILAAAVADRVGWYRAGKWTVVWAEFRIEDDPAHPGDEAEPSAAADGRDQASAKDAADGRHRATSSARAA